MATKFEQIYNCFYSKITDDMYMELDEQQTKAMAYELLINALPWFEFPRVNIMDYDATSQIFKATLSQEEINIIANYMMQGWFDQQLASIELVRMKYSGSDFKFTSQANHMSKLMALKKEYERVGFHLQRLYKRRKANSKGVMKSTFGNIMSTSVRQGNITYDNNTNSNCDCEELEWEDFIEKDETSGDDWEEMTSNPSNDDHWETM